MSPTVRSGRSVRVMVAVTPLIGPAVALLSLVVAGDLQSRSVGDPAVAVRIALPVAELFRNLAVAAVLGLLVVAVWVLGPGDRMWSRLLDAAAVAASVWAAAAAVTGVLTFVSASGLTPADRSFSGELVGYLTGIVLGRAWAVETIAAASLAVLCVLVRSHTGALVLLLLGAGALLPVLVLGHGGGGSDESVEVPGLVVHVLAAATWTGGLAVVALVVSRRPTQLGDVLARYGDIALLSLIAVAVTGTVSALLHLGPGVPLDSPYALLVVGKVGLLIVAGVLGGSVRLRLLRRMSTGRRRRGIGAVLGAELVALVAAIGVAAALTRTPSPESDAAAAPVVTPAEALIGRALPAPFSPLQLVSAWRPDLLWISVGVVLAVGYAIGIGQVRRRGGRWPIGRVLAWYSGVAALVLLTCGGANLYEQVLLSVHVMSKLLLLVPIPALLVAGAPGRLIESSGVRRTDGSRGLYEWCHAISALPVVRKLARPLPAALLAAGTLTLLYSTGLLEWETRQLVGHEAITAWLLLIGLLLRTGWKRVAEGRVLSVALLSAGLVGLAMWMLIGARVGAEWFFALGWPDPRSDQHQAGVAVLLVVSLGVVVATVQIRRARIPQP